MAALDPIMLNDQARFWQRVVANVKPGTDMHTVMERLSGYAEPPETPEDTASRERVWQRIEQVDLPSDVEPKRDEEWR